MSAEVTGNVYLEFLRDLNAIEVRYAVLHGWESLLYGEMPSDIDIVVAPEDLNKVEASLRERYRVLNLFHYEASSFGFVLCPKEQDPPSLFVADFSSDYRWRGRIFFTGEQLLVDRRQWHECWVVGAAQEFAYLLVKKLYEKGAIPEKQKLRLEQLCEELRSAASAVSSRLFGTVWGDRLIGWIMQRRWDQVARNLPPLQRQLRWQILRHDPFNSLRYWLAEIRRAWLRCWYPTGLSVAVLGPDGPEKRAVLRELKIGMAQAFRHIRTLEWFPTRTAAKGNKARKGQFRNSAEVSGQLTRWEFVRTLLSQGLQLLFRVRPLLVRSTLVVLENNCENLLVSEDLEAAQFARRIIPSPNVSFFIRANERSSAEAIAQTTRRRIYGYLNDRYCGRYRMWFPHKTCEAD